MATIIIIITIIEAEVDRPLLPVRPYTTLNDNKLFIILKHTLQHIKAIRIHTHTRAHDDRHLTTRLVFVHYILRTRIQNDDDLSTTQQLQYALIINCHIISYYMNRIPKNLPT